MDDKERYAIGQQYFKTLRKDDQRFKTFILQDIEVCFSSGKYRIEA